MVVEKEKEKGKEKGREGEEGDSVRRLGEVCSRTVVGGGLVLGVRGDGEGAERGIRGEEKREKRGKGGRVDPVAVALGGQGNGVWG